MPLSLKATNVPLMRSELSACSPSADLQFAITCAPCAGSETCLFLLSFAKYT